ncbi:MAG: diguanylate cyclase domain-containing protein, partial [Mycobacteriales bacterium]
MIAAIALTLLAGLFGWLGWRAHRALRARDERFRVLVERSSDLITVVSPDLRIVDQSDSLTGILGYPRGSRIRRPLGELVHADDRAALLGLLADGVIPPGQVERVTVRVHHADGSWRWLEIAVRNLVADRRVAGFVLNCRDVTDTRDLLDSFERLALSDPLTGFANRPAFEAAVGRALSADGSAPVTVLLVDLDDFGLVNDGLGREAGDQVLELVALRLRRAISAEDVLARFGGCQFAVLAVGLAPGGPESAARRLLTALRPMLEVAGHEVLVHASIGVASAEPAGTVDELLRDAQAAMSEAKRDPTLGWRRFDPSMREEAQHRRSLAVDLRAAVREGQLECAFQPIVDLASGNLLSLEALVRWHHPVEGVVAPGGFIRYAEDSGLIHELGSWVLRHACTRAQEWSLAS